MENFALRKEGNIVLRHKLGNVLMKGFLLLLLATQKRKLTNKL